MHFRNFFFFLPREAFFFFFFLRFFFRNLPPLLLFGDLFFAASSSLPRLVLSSRLVNVLPSMVLVLPCCVLCIPKMFWFALLLLDYSSVQAYYVACKKKFRIAKEMCYSCNNSWIDSYNIIFMYIFLCCVSF